MSVHCAWGGGDGDSSRSESEDGLGGWSEHGGFVRACWCGVDGKLQNELWGRLEGWLLGFQEAGAIQSPAFLGDQTIIIACYWRAPVSSGGGLILNRSSPQWLPWGSTSTSRNVLRDQTGCPHQKLAPMIIYFYKCGKKNQSLWNSFSWQ